MATQIPFFVLSIVLLVIHAHAHASIEELEVNPGFSYSGGSCPDKWGSLSAEYGECSNGKSQSPIDIVTKNAAPKKELSALQREYGKGKAYLINNGYNIQLKLTNGGTLNTPAGRSENYTLEELRWHTPSEHTIDGSSFDAELHQIHKNSQGDYVIVAILYKIGDDDNLLAKFQKKLGEFAGHNCPSDQKAQIEIENFDANKLRRKSPKYYTYTGSLTTPPCKEGVVFIVPEKVRTISKRQLEILKAPLLSSCKSNNRTVQPLNNRTVDLFVDNDSGN